MLGSRRRVDVDEQPSCLFVRLIILYLLADHPRMTDKCPHKFSWNATHIDPIEDRVRKHVAFKPCVRKHSPFEFGIQKTGLHQPGHAQVSFTQGGMAQIGADQIGSAQVRLAQIRPCTRFA